jgi:AcrR family transcriptional regulator
MEYSKREDNSPDVSGRGDKTRQSLIQAGIDLFSEYGFKSSSTRMIAEKAGANIASIPYYFGSKEGLYLAVAEYIGSRIGEHIEPLYSESAEALASGRVDKEFAEKTVAKVVSVLLDFIIGTEEPRRWALIVLREQARPTKAFKHLYDPVMGRAHAMLSRLIAVASGLEPESDESKIKAHAVIGQVLSFMAARETIIRQLGTDGYTEKHLELMHKIIPAMAVAAINAEPEA